MLTDLQRQVIDLHDQEGLSFKKIAMRLGKDHRNMHRSYKAARKKLNAKKARLDPGVHGVLDRFGMGDLAAQHSGWVHRENKETGEWVSTYYYLGKDGETSEIDLEDMLARALTGAKRRSGKGARPRRPAPTGDALLVIDIADLHIGKLAMKSETGFAYNRETALNRGIEGVRRLLRNAKKFGFAHILFVIGNDAIHIDTPKGGTTSGTPQDTDGTLHAMFEDAFDFYVEAIDLCRAEAPVSLLYCPSNHDWFAGYALAKAVKAHYRKCPEVSASDYNTSPRHRKYFVFGGNLIGLTHHDGAKENDLPSLMLEEASAVLSACPVRYWYLHHLHHKVVRRGQGRAKYLAEKDLAGAITVICNDPDARAQGLPEFEIVRSPSPPDGWHDRNGYVNRQAVECFLHDPHEGAFARFTEWF